MFSPLITLKDVCVRLGGRDILRSVCTGIPRNRITALVGLNGSGKTTLLRVLLGEIPCQGELRYWCGHDHRRPAPEHVGYVPQKLRIEANMPLTVKDLFGLALLRRPLFFGVPRTLAAKMRTMLDRVNAPHQLLDQPMDRLSGGEQQRVLLALALDPNPELLLLDEPAAGIDFKDQEKFYELIANINTERKVTVLIVSHDLSIVHRFAHHVLCLQNGVIAAEGTPNECLTANRLREIFGMPWHS